MTERAVLALVLGAAWGLVGPECRSATPNRATSSQCLVEPAGEVRVYLEGVSDSLVTRFAGQIVSLSPADVDGFIHFQVREPSGRLRDVALNVPGGATPLRVGMSANFRIDVAPGTPGASALVVRDDQGLLFAAASDQAPGAAVLRDGLEGFTLALESTGCSSRAHDACLESVTNQRLRARYAVSEVALYHGDSAALGRWRVRCLTAQSVKYAPHCADVALFGVSYLIVRES